MRLLVIDDEEHLRRMMRLTLEAAGYEVGEAAGGEEGLRLFGDGSAFDATLLDQRMPDVDGLEVLRRMKAIRSEARILMVTAYATIDLAVDAMKLGATDFVRKPMTPDTLRHAVAAALEKRGLTSSPVAPSPPPSEPPAPAGQVPPTEIWTTNGFFVRRLEDAQAPAAGQAVEHHFLVRRGRDDTGTDVAVSIAATVVAGTARQARRSLPPSSPFWRQQAETALLNHLWNDAELPAAGRLVIDRVMGTIVNAAMSWPAD